MADFEFDIQKHDGDEFNGGDKYQDGDGLQPTTINNLIENSLYQTAYVESLSQTPDTSQAGSVGTPTVLIIDDDYGYKKFKFSYLKGETGTTPRIGGNGNWFIGDVDTGFPARGLQGKAGLTFSYNSTTKKLTILTDSDVQ